MVFPVGTHDLPPAIVAPIAPLHAFFESLIDKKVNQVALTFFERIADFFCRHLYGSYCRRLESRLNLHEANPGIPNQHPGIVHTFSDGAPLYDRTREGLARVKRINVISLLPRGPSTDYEILTWDDKKIRFQQDLQSGDMLFGRRYYTDYVTVQNNPENPDEIEIIEQETLREGAVAATVNKWVVNTRQVQNLCHGINGLTFASESVYQARPMPLAQPHPNLFGEEAQPTDLAIQE